MSHPDGPHQGQPILQMGAALGDARAAMLLVHGRGAPPDDLLSLVPFFGQADFAYLALAASQRSWYPYSFLSPIEDNEPGISSGLRAIGEVLAEVEAAGIPAERVMLLGFSQGACLSLEYAARNPRRFGGLAGLSGGLIGPPGMPRAYSGSLAGTPVFLGCSDVDPHIPKARVQETTVALTGIGAEVTERIYPNMGHTIVQDEIDFVRGMMEALLAV